MGVKDLVAQQQSAITADSLYGSKEDQTALYQAVSKFAPWVKGEHPMSAEEVLLVVRRVTSMGLDPLNPHEVQIWKDRHGVQTQHAYTILVEWLRHFKGDITEPQYDRLTETELEEEGLGPEDIGYRVRFLMKEDIDRLPTLIEAGFEPKQARRMLEVTGLGVATRDEYDGRYFAPKGRSRSWKVKKRAMTDAIRRKFGTPTRAEVVELRRLRGDAKLTLEDWQVVEAEMPPDDQLQLARNAAQNREWREEFESLSDEEKRDRLDHYRDLLSGSEEDREGFEAEAADEDEDQPSPEPEVIDGVIADKDPFGALMPDKPDIYEAATYKTPKGATLGMVKRRELSNMLDYFTEKGDLGEEAQTLKAHVETCLAYLKDYRGNIDVYSSLDPWEPPKAGDDAQEQQVDAEVVVKELRFAGGWMLKGEEWLRGETDAPEEKAMQRAAAIIGDAVGGDDDKRHDLLAVLFGESSTKALNAWEVNAVIERWQKEEGTWKANNQGFFEAHALLDAHSLPGFTDSL